MINRIGISNNIKISPYYNQNNTTKTFTSHPNPSANENNSSHKKSKIILGTLLLASSAVLAAIVLKKVKANNKIKKLKDELSQVYDKSWEFLLKDFDKNKIKIEKPKLLFSSKTESKSLAGYRPQLNDVTLNIQKFQNNEYIAYKGDAVMSSGATPLHTEQNIAEMRKQGIIDNTWTVKKLSHAEKMFYYNAIIAHEQRHCLQFHMILNDANFGADSLINVVAERIQKEKPTISKEKAMELAKKDSPYWVNFKPICHNPDLTLNSPVRYGGKQVCFKTKNFIRNFSEYDSKNVEKYNLNSLEIDANIYALNYLKSIKKLQDNAGNPVLEILTGADNAITFEKLEKFLEANKESVR